MEGIKKYNKSKRRGKLSKYMSNEMYYFLILYSQVCKGNLYYCSLCTILDFRAMSRISRLRSDMNNRTFYKERKINNRSFEFLDYKFH